MKELAKVIAMIPARLGSQRLKKKNLQPLMGVPLISRAVRKCLEADCFDEVWINSEAVEFKPIADREGVGFHQRPVELGNNEATSEQFVAEFLNVHECDYLIQVHSIAPLLSSIEVAGFVEDYLDSGKDVMLSCVLDQIEVAFKGQPINFTFNEKTNSQDLSPVQRVTWSITGWKRNEFLDAFNNGKCATYSGDIGFYNVSPISGHVIKTQEDLDIASTLMKVIGQK